MAFRISRRDLLLGAMATVFRAPAAEAAERIDFVTYHDQPPLVIEAGVGLSYDLARYFTDQAAGPTDFETILMPRRRLDNRLEDPALRAQTLVPWVNPAWFKPAQLALMTPSVTILDDPDVILSRSKDAIQYTGPDDLIGRRFGGVRGHHYPGIDELVEHGKIIRQDLRSFAVAIDSLRVGRIDATLVPQSSFHYLVSNPMREVYHVSAIPGEDPSRAILVPRERPELLTLVNRVIGNMRTDPAWRGILDGYHLTRTS